jgi:hypothetical protein
MTKTLDRDAGLACHSCFVIHSSFVIRHSSFSADELNFSLGDSARSATERRCYHAVRPSMENFKQFDLNRGGACKFYL